MPKAYCNKCKEYNEVAPGFINGGPINCPNCGTVREDYPYWKPEFNELFGKNNQVIYSSNLKTHKYNNNADSYRVFMILCNNNYNKSRMEVLEMLKNSTREFPIQIDNEFFWTEKYD